MNLNQIINESVNQRDKETLVRLLHDRQNLDRRIEEIAGRVFPDIPVQHNYHLDTYSLIDAL